MYFCGFFKISIEKKSMKKILFAALALSTFLGCSNDFKLTDDWKDIPIVYGFLNQKDTAHYLRIEKAFLDPITSALVIAKISDSLYYDNVAVYLEKENGQRFALTRVDGNLEGHPRDTGIFAQAPNYLYKIKQSELNLQAGKTVRLVIDRGDNLPLDTASTVILGNIDIKSPSKVSSGGLSFKTGEQFNFRWTVSLEAQIFDISATIRVVERKKGTTDFTVRTLFWPIERNVKRVDVNEPTTTYKIAGGNFFKFLKENLSPDPTIDRFIPSQGIDFRIDGGGVEINEYNDVLNANSGISGAELLPIYTNMSQGFGLFTSRGFTIETGFGINAVTRDSLINGQYTYNLGFIP
jgi:hypothetical protein